MLIWAAGMIVGDAVRPVGAWLLRPLGRALRSNAGFLVLVVVWMFSAGWFWLAWQAAVAGQHAWAQPVFITTLLCAPALAMLSSTW
ncbi:hypothetical protein [Longimicrobium sp.]|jgi:hypothetical protein|uniref:hypothetical protein n=1 Tax=Longimicrobium sp. TaxID=2029185 RepID=UPI002ED9A568